MSKCFEKKITKKWTVGDVNNDGKVDVADIATILTEMAAQARVDREETTE